MIDTVFQCLILGLGLPLCLATTYRAKTIVHPVNVIFALFFVPLYFCMFRFSNIQATSWDYETYTALASTLGAWLLFPAIAILVWKMKDDAPYQEWRGMDVVGSAPFSLFARLFALIVLASYFAGNYLQAKTLLPMLHPQQAFAIHAEFPFGLRFFARACPAAAIVLYVAYWRRRQPLDLILFIMAVLLPLTRLSRIDLAITMVALAVIWVRMPLFQVRGWKLWVLAVLGILVMVGAVELGTLRQNRFGMYEFKYSDLIGWKPRVVGPSEIFPVLYGYTSLSFENFNEAVKSFHGRHTWALFSFDWLYSGFIKLNWFTRYGLAQALTLRYEIVSGAAAVPTALVPFFADGGAVGMAVPMMLYMSLWLYFFHRSRTSVGHLMLYGLYTGAFALASFQALMSAAIIMQQVAWIWLVYKFAKLYAKRQTAARNAPTVHWREGIAR